jgi:hypothetical protein
LWIRRCTQFDDRRIRVGKNSGTSLTQHGVCLCRGEFPALDTKGILHATGSKLKNYKGYNVSIIDPANPALRCNNLLTLKQPLQVICRTEPNNLAAKPRRKIMLRFCLRPLSNRRGTLPPMVRMLSLRSAEGC